MAAIAVIVVALRVTRPVYLTGEPIASGLLDHAYLDSLKVRVPWLRSSAAVALQTPQFLLDREYFAMDLLRTGKLNQARARALADVAVREAYTRKIPPALVLGVMLTENDELKSSARSNVGAVGLMQVNARPWRDLGRKFGTNVHTDSVNLKYGIYILGWVTGKAADIGINRDEAWRSAMLRYNGCIKGTNTKDCHSYPDVVRRRVQQAARETCRGADFDQCVMAPMWFARRTVDDSVGPSR